MNASNRLKRGALGLLLKMLPSRFKDRLAVHLGRPDLRFSFLQLRRFGFMPKHLLDGGAYHGDWTRLCLEIWPEASVLCIEPQKSASAALNALASEKAPKVDVMQVLLGAADQAGVPFAASGTGSSVYSSAIDSDPCEMWRIDSLINQGMKPFDFVKLDVQGYELQVLSGFEQYLLKCDMLQLELSLLPISPGAPLAAEVIAYLLERGFVMYDIEEIIRAPSDGAVWQFDALFCREDSSLRTDRSW